MIQWLFPKIIGGKDERELNRIRPIIKRINEIEGALQCEPAEKLLQLTANWQRQLARYHPLEIPATPQIERMDEAELAATAAALEARLAVLRPEFAVLPSRVTGTVASIESA
jgi:preprotein translocase subunit SecA